MTDSLIPDSPKADAARREMLFVLGATAVLCAYMVLMTIGTLPVLGDGSYHFRRATVYYETGFPWHRATHDPAYTAEGYPTPRYFNAGLWHMGLAVVWRVVGSPSLLVAQIYQAAFFYALAVLTYLVGRELYGRRGGLWAWVILISIPMNLLFGMVFYLEVPLLAFTAAALYALLHRRAIVMGLALAGMFLTKTPSALVLAPPILLAGLVLMGSTWRSRLLRTVPAIAVCLVAMAPDMAWRYQHFGQAIMIRDTATTRNIQLRYPSAPVKKTAIPFHIASLRIDLEMFGVAGCVATAGALGLAALGLARALRRIFLGWRSSGLRGTLASMSDLCGAEFMVAELPLLVYLTAFLVMLRGSYDARYAQPIVLFASLLAGGILVHAHPFTWHGRLRWLGRLVAAGIVLSMVVQVIAVPLHIHAQRRLSPETAAAFAWIRENTPPRAKFLYLEANLNTLTGRPFVWAAARPHYLFEVPEPEQMRLLYYLGVEYIAIHPTRQCDAVEPGTEPIAYPRPWVRSLETRPYLERVYPPGRPETLEGQFLIYHIDPTKVPTEWTRDLKLPEKNPYHAFVPAT